MASTIDAGTFGTALPRPKAKRARTGTNAKSSRESPGPKVPPWEDPRASSPIVQAIKALYGIASDINAYLDGLINDMKASPNVTVALTARVIEGAKYGFGVGYVTSVVVITLGQMILGNPLVALWNLATGAVLHNPIAMTCAAVGAIYFGWRALSEEERNAILKKLGDGLQVGVELIKAIAAFVVAKTKELLTAEGRAAFKKFIADAAAQFGRTLADVTGLVADRIAGVANTVKEAAGDVAHSIAGGASEAYEYASVRMKRKKEEKKQ